MTIYINLRNTASWLLIKTEFVISQNKETKLEKMLALYNMY